MTVTEEFEAANAEYAETFVSGQIPVPPAKKVVILTCMDCRLDPDRFLGLHEGDAHVIRNAGGRASVDAIRSIVISEQVLGTDTIVVIHHTDCGMLSFTNESLCAEINSRSGIDASGFDFLPFKDLDQSVRDDMATIRNSPIIPNTITIAGYVYDVDSGRLLPVRA